MKDNNDRSGKLSLYPTDGLRRRIDSAYENYRMRVEGDSSLLAKPVSKSSWLLSLLTPALEAVGHESY